MARLNTGEISRRLGNMTDWSLSDGQLRRTYTCTTFQHATAFVVHIAMLAEAADHHPDIDIRYNTVVVTLSTHSEGGITEKDFDMATSIDAAFET